MSPLQQILAAYRDTSQAEREKGSYFEELIRIYFRQEPRFADVWLYSDTLGKELPRISAVKSFGDFRAFSQAGHDLTHRHLKYETVALHPGATLDTGKTPLRQLTDADFRVTKMKIAKTKDPVTGKSVNDKTTLIWNERITICDIPLAAYDTIVNGKPALEWVMERQAVTTDKDSGIVNDANLWATETMGNARYPLELFQRVITVSLETMKIVNRLPKLEIVGSVNAANHAS